MKFVNLLKGSLMSTCPIVIYIILFVEYNSCLIPFLFISGITKFSKIYRKDIKKMKKNPAIKWKRQQASISDFKVFTTLS